MEVESHVRNLQSNSQPRARLKHILASTCYHAGLSSKRTSHLLRWIYRFLFRFFLEPVANLATSFRSSDAPHRILQ